MNQEQIDQLSSFRKHVIKHKDMKMALEELKILHKTGLHEGGAECMMLLGPSGSGKSRTIELYALSFPPVREAERDRCPVLIVETPPRATLKGVAEVMLAALGDPAPAKGTTQSMTRRVENLLRNCGVELVVIDEFQHLVDREKRGGRIAHDVADWIKGLLNRRICPFVLAGTELADSVLEANIQLQRRCSTIVRLRPLGFGSAEEQ